MSDHTSKQFDAEMEEIHSGVLSMGGLVEKQMARGIALLGGGEDRALVDAVGADEQQINRSARRSSRGGSRRRSTCG